MWPAVVCLKAVTKLMLENLNATTYYSESLSIHESLLYKYCMPVFLLMSKLFMLYTTEYVGALVLLEHTMTDNRL